MSEPDPIDVMARMAEEIANEVRQAQDGERL